MAQITEERAYNGARDRIERLGLGPLIDEVREILTGFELRVLEEKDKNGGAALRELIDARFLAAGNWRKAQTGAVDWIKCLVINGSRLCVGVEIQVSARSDLLIMDIVHLRKRITDGLIDLGILVVPSDRLAVYLTDRAPSMADAVRHVDQARADDLPLLLIALEHDGPGNALPKRRKRTAKE